MENSRLNIYENKIEEFRKPAFDLFRCLQDEPYKLPLGYMYLIVDESDLDPNKTLIVPNEQQCLYLLGTTQPNPFEYKEGTIKIRNYIDDKVHEILKI